jgi:hypothetical protein
MSIVMLSDVGSQHQHRHPARLRLILTRSIAAVYSRRQSEVVAHVTKANRMESGDDEIGVAQEAPASLHLSLRDQTNDPLVSMMAVWFKSQSRSTNSRLINREVRA